MLLYKKLLLMTFGTTLITECTPKGIIWISGRGISGKCSQRCDFYKFPLRISTGLFKTGKAVPLQAWSSRKLRFPDFMTTAQDGGKIVSLTHRPPLPPGNAPDTHFC